MAMEAESMQRYKSQSAVRGTSLAPAQAKSTKPKDLTDSLMSQVYSAQSYGNVYGRQIVSTVTHLMSQFC